MRKISACSGCSVIGHRFTQNIKNKLGNHHQNSHIEYIKTRKQSSTLSNLPKTKAANGDMQSARKRIGHIREIIFAFIMYAITINGKDKADIQKNGKNTSVKSGSRTQFDLGSIDKFANVSIKDAIKAIQNAYDVPYSEYEYNKQRIKEAKVGPLKKLASLLNLSIENKAAFLEPLIINGIDAMAICVSDDMTTLFDKYELENKAALLKIYIKTIHKLLKNEIQYQDIEWDNNIIEIIQILNKEKYKVFDSVDIRKALTSLRPRCNQGRNVDTTKVNFIAKLDMEKEQNILEYEIRTESSAKYKMPLLVGNKDTFSKFLEKAIPNKVLSTKDSRIILYGEAQHWYDI